MRQEDFPEIFINLGYASEGNYHSEYGYSCMGYEIAGALGAKMAEPKREVYSVLGDGSYLCSTTKS